MWNLKKMNYICRILSDDESKFKFDVLLRSDILITDGKLYDTFESASNALCSYLNKLYKFEQTPNLHGNNHLVITETVFDNINDHD